MTWRYVGLSILITVAVVSGCSSTSSPPTGTSDCNVDVARFKELVVVDEAVIGDAVRARNDGNGVWSFRHAVEELVPTGTNTSAFVESWLQNWASTKTVNGYQLDRAGESRQETMQSVVICPWLKTTPANGCTADCSSCTERTLDLKKAPFRLAAITNRMDLRGRSDVGLAGEGRLVFHLTQGPADDPSSRPSAMSVIFEYDLPTHQLNPRDWAMRWHALASHESFGEEYRRDLEVVTELFVKHGSAPSKINQSAINQVRTNESALNWIWQLREFRLDLNGQLRISPTSNTPAEDLNNSALLQKWVAGHEAEILSDQHVVPPSLLGGASDLLTFRWSVPGVSEGTRRAFARGTCNGCHSGENPTVDTAFHVSPYRSGVARLSPFLNNPSAPQEDELAAREKKARALLCQ